MRMHHILSAVVVCAVLTAVQISFADTVTFKNGDRLSGKIGLIEGEKFTLTTDLAAPPGAPMGAGKMTLVFNWTDVATFTTDKPIEIHLKDGVVLKSITTNAVAGAVDLKNPVVVETKANAPAPASQPTELTFSQIKIVNPGYGEIHGNIAAGALLARGNTYTDNINASGEVTRKTEQDLFTLDAQYIYGDQKVIPTGPKTTSAENWFVQPKYDYNLNPKLYAFAIDRLDKDRIALVSIRDAASVGLGYNWAASDTFNLWTEAGPGYFYEKYVTGGSDEHVTARLAYHIDKTWGNFMVFHDMQFFPSLDSISDFFLTTDAGLRITMTPLLFTQFQVQLDHQQRPAPGAEKDDVRYIFSVGLNF